MTPDVARLPAKLPSRAAFVQRLVAPWEWDTYGPNMLLTGSQGMGKTVLLAEISAALDSTVEIIRWWDHPVGDREHVQPGALAAAMSGDGSVLGAYHRARAWLLALETDRPLLVVLDDVHLVPEFSRQVLAELTRNQEISILAATTSVRLTGRAISQLWRDGLLPDHRIPDLSMGDVTELARAVLGREPELAETANVLRVSEAVVGHAAVALEDVAQESRAGADAQDKTEQRRALLEAVLQTTDLATEQLSILQVLARLREFPASIVVGLFGAENLDALMENGVLSLRGRGVSRGVVMTNSWIATLITELTSPQRDRELYDLLAPYRFDPRVGPGASADLLLWRHSLGLPVDSQRGTHLAELAAQNADYVTVQRLICALDEGAYVQDERQAAHLHGLHTLALASLGQIDAAAELAEPLLKTPPRPEHPLEAREVEALYVLAAMSTQQRRKAGEFESLLSIAKGHHRVLRMQDSKNLTQNTAVEEAALSAHWILENFRGDYKTLLDSIARASAARTVERTTRALMVGLSAKAGAICGRPVDGQAILARAVRVDLAARNARLAQQHTQDAAMIAGIFAGQWGELLDQVQRQESGLPDTPGWVQHNVLRGSLLLLTGRPHQAVDYLQLALQATDGGHAFPVPQLVISLSAAAYAWVGRTEEARQLLESRPVQLAQEPYLYRAAGEYFRGLTEFLLGDVAGGVQRWRSWADDTAQRGCDGLSLLFLQALARAGSEFAVRELGITAARCQGAWAQSLQQLAQALEHQKITDLRAALRCAAGMGDLSLAGYLERIIAQRGQTASAGPVLPFPDDEVVEAGTGEMDSRAVSMAAVLTGREREIADLAAAGLSNQSIAEEVGLSRRTVEGHMRQVLRKLNISRRTELVDLWKGTQG
ncbi:helix-turn-helix transcriptional regulator [Kocuria sp.]|uniref:helix-turn-helix transcriptional regulator n=1 Tax=Kocuria sp. TaxID=1871328 RepID=UPI0026E0F474|nr:LuxR C-terminal-related transcriptional regulator [Kocuria sp.]MDO5619069.1 LuxR C-terminal-related transcriptional regulator [Kocuria sp.]